MNAYTKHNNLKKKKKIKRMSLRTILQNSLPFLNYSYRTHIKSTKPMQTFFTFATIAFKIMRKLT